MTVNIDASGMTIDVDGYCNISSELNVKDIVTTTIFTPLPFMYANVPSAADNVGAIIFVVDGLSGSPTLAMSNGTDWLTLTFGSAISP